MTSKHAAVMLAAAPISAVTASQSLLPPCGFDTASMSSASHRLLTTWARVGQMNTTPNN